MLLKEYINKKINYKTLCSPNVLLCDISILVENQPISTQKFHVGEHCGEFIKTYRMDQLFQVVH